MMWALIWHQGRLGVRGADEAMSQSRALYSQGKPGIAILLVGTFEQAHAAQFNALQEAEKLNLPKKDEKNQVFALKRSKSTGVIK